MSINYLEIKEKIRGWLKPELPTAAELEEAARLAPGEYEIYNGKINSILDEAREVFIRTGVSSFLRSGDLVVGIYTAAGDLVSASCGTFLHAQVAQLPVKYILTYLKDAPTVGVKDGDIFYCNEALTGGVHNPDQIAIMPVFANGELMAWTSAAAHQPETGATEPGGMPVGARNRHYEGMKLTPIKIAENFLLRQDLMDMMVNFISRAPRMQEIDVRARCSAADRMRRRLLELSTERGVPFVRGLFRCIIQHAEEGTRKKIHSWIPGVYRAVAFFDTIGHQEGLVRTVLTVTNDGERLTFDLTGTSPESASSYNAFLHTTAAFVGHYLHTYPMCDLPASAGTYGLLSFHVPDGCYLNASSEASVANSPIIGRTVVSLCHSVFARMLFASPDQGLCAASPGIASGGAGFSGVNQWGVPVADFITYLLNTEGGGARPDKDGMDSHGFLWAPWGKARDAEDMEEEYTFLTLAQKHMKNSCGFGRRRGGSGSQLIYVVYHAPQVSMYSLGKGSRIPHDSGIFGGYAPATPVGVQVTGTDIFEKLREGNGGVPSDVIQLVSERSVSGTYTLESVARPNRILQEGDIFVGLNTGGGGFGDVLEREPEAVIKDLREQIITHWTAQNVYHVVYDPQTLRADPQQTEERRRRERADRINRGKPYVQFEQEWLSKRPREDILRLYGTWPDARPMRS